MNVSQMIAELRAERDALVNAMAVLENIARSRGRRRGRPPAWLAGITAVKPAPSGPKRAVSAATRKKMAAAQKKRWSAAKKGQA